MNESLKTTPLFDLFTINTITEYILLKNNYFKEDNYLDKVKQNLKQITMIGIEPNLLLDILEDKKLINKNTDLFGILLDNIGVHNKNKLTKKHIEYYVDNYIDLINSILVDNKLNINSTFNVNNVTKNVNNTNTKINNNKLLKQLKTFISKVKQLKLLIKLLKYIKEILTYKKELNIIISENINNINSTNMNTNTINKENNRENNKDKSKKEIKNKNELNIEEIKMKINILKNIEKELNNTLANNNNKQQKENNPKQTDKINTKTNKNNSQQVHHKDTKENDKTINQQTNNIIQKIVNTQIKIAGVKKEKEDLKKNNELNEGQNSNDMKNEEIKNTSNNLSILGDFDIDENNNTEAKEGYIETIEDNLDNIEGEMDYDNLLDSLTDTNGELEKGEKGEKLIF